VAELPPGITWQSQQRDLLLRTANSRDLDDTEQAELDRLNTALDALANQRETTRATLINAAAEVGRADAEARLDPGKSIRRYLRRNKDRKAVVLQYVVLPHRMGAVLTTPAAQQVYSWDTLNGAPFAEAALNDLISEFRAALRDPGSDPVALAQALHALLLPPELSAEIAAAGAETLMISPDRQLRYIPFAALHDGTGWLVENYAVTHATAGGVVAAADEPVDRIAAFGMTQAADGFAALPAVAREVDAVVRDAEDDPGALQGRARLNGEFTQDSLAGSVVFSDLDTDRLGVLHLASHFKLGPTEAESFLLLGDGSRLNVETMRNGLGRDADLSEVALLTLSACETAYGATRADGRELESFAAVAQRQGARSVLATLWPVADGSTAGFMGGFYARFADGMPVAEALAASQRLMLAGAEDDVAQAVLRGAFDLDAPTGTPTAPGWTHPFFWAPFLTLEGAI